MRAVFRTALLLILFALTGARTGIGQGYINQVEVASLLDRRAPSLDEVPEVAFEYYVLPDPEWMPGNNAVSRNIFLNHIGETRAEQEERRILVEMINRTLLRNVHIGDTLVVPTRFDLDFRAYSPFPRYYEGGAEFDKLFIMDKTIQAFGAYEYGELVRWGIINTGNPNGEGGKDHSTPNGRYNFNWKVEERVSSESPDNEPWLMRWVVNFHKERGMHVHQYEMPTGGPESHGCVRLVDADARWIYDWADTWKTTVRGDGPDTIGGRIIKQGTTVLVLGEEPAGKPHPFYYRTRHPIILYVELPEHPYDVPPGTDQQRQFDRRRR